MKIYEVIIKVLDKNGATKLPILCEEVNSILQENYQINIFQLKASLRQKKDVFIVENGLVSIAPEKQLISLFFHKTGFSGTVYEVRVNFEKNRFTHYEWNLEGVKGVNINIERKPGSVDEFRREIFNLNLWNWSKDYQKEKGVIIDGTSWSVELVTKAKRYKSQGIESFPSEWSKLCRIIERLTGIPL